MSTALQKGLCIIQIDKGISSVKNSVEFFKCL